jgi:cardiolipin synthase
VTVHSLAILVSILIYVLTTRAIRERRPPSIAIAWVLGMIALPYIALPTYLMFGRRKMPRKKTSPGGVRRHGRHWAEDLIESFDLGPASDARVHLHRDGNESAAALFATLQSAKFRLDVCTYILGNDPFGLEVIRRMAECVERGVVVRLLLDGVGAIQLPRAFFERLKTAGIKTEIFSPLLARKTQGPRNLRNHRKMAIADGAQLWAGGRNIAAEYFIGLHGEAPWRDLSFDLDGPVAGEAAKQFEADWVAAGGEAALEQGEGAALTSGVHLSGGHQSVVRTGAVLTGGLLTGAVHKGSVLTGAVHTSAVHTSAVPARATPTSAVPEPASPAHAIPEAALSRAQFLPSGPDQTEDTVHALLIDACFHVRERILAVTPYFVPDASLETALRLAARRGVQIDLVLPASSNHRLADFARNRALRSLHRAGVAIHLVPFMNHAKAVVFDDSLALTGSVNLDSRSLLLNYESAVVLYGAAEISWLADWIAALIPQSRPFDARAPGIVRDIGEGLLLTVAYQL